MARTLRCASAILQTIVLLVLQSSTAHGQLVNGSTDARPDLAGIARVAARFSMGSVGGEPCSTSTALSAPAKSFCGNALVLEATVTPALEGAVTFFAGSVDLGVSPVDEAGIATLTLSHGLAIGAHLLTASFAPLESCAPSTSPAIEHQVNARPTTLALAAPETLACGTRLTMTATVTPASAGTVTFYDGLDPIATTTVSSGIATASLPSGLLAGSHSLVASYSPSSSCSGPSTSNTIAHSVTGAATTLTLQSPSSSLCGQDLSLTASLSPVFSGTIRFFAGSTLLGAAPVNGFGTASIVIGSLPAGEHELFATYTPGSGCPEPSVSDSHTIVVQPAPTSLALTSSHDPSSAGDIVAITARITPASAQGTVELFDGATSLGTAPITQGVINFNPTFAEGDHSLTATFTDGDCWSSSVSPVLVQHVVARPTISIADASVVEGNGELRGVLFAVTMDAPLMNRTVTLHVKSYPGTAGAGVDYQSIDQDMVVSNGQTSTTVFVPVIGDRHDEPDENLTVVLSDADLASLGDPVAVGTIVDDDGPPALTLSNVRLGEGHEGTTSFVFTAALSNPSSFPVSADWTVIDQTATVENGDYAPVSGSLSFAPLDSVETLTVPANGDRTFESDEVFRVVISNPVNATWSQLGGFGTILNDDGAPQIEIDDAVITEADAGQSALAFRVRLATMTTETVRVNYTTEDGTALANTDYLPASGTLTIDPKSSEGFITVQVHGDEICEHPSEAFAVRISNPSGGAIVRNTGTGTIVDQDCTAGVGPGALPLLDLAPIRPNPAQGVVRLEYALGRDADLTLDILDVQGREVATIARGPLAPGRYQATWSGLGSRGPAPAGLYFARCRGAGRTLVRRFVFTP